jgi:hypothetical protein
MRPIKRLSISIVLLLVGAWAASSLWAQTLPEAGFITLEKTDHYFHSGSWSNRIALRSSPTRLWYVYQPADEDPLSKPLFVFFNGGPGSATSTGLLSTNTGRLTVWRDGTTGYSAIIVNSASWTRIGNILYVDSRTAGFSYSLMDDPSDEEARWAEFDAQNYNPFIDGTDFVRLILRFLDAHPAIRSNRVVLVPESYGGIRTDVMLHLLLYYERYRDGSEVYQNPELVEEIRRHYNLVFPEYAGGTVPPSAVARQFGHQILIQTALTWPYQRQVAVEKLEAPGSILDQLAAETGVPYVRYRDQPGANPNPTPNQVMNYIYSYLDQIGRDPYICSKPAAFFQGQRDAARAFLTRTDTLSLLIGLDAAQIQEMYAAARGQAYKTKYAGGYSYDIDFSALIGPPPSEEELAGAFAPAGEDDMAAVFGGLKPWDRFFIDSNPDVTNAFAWNLVTFQGYDVAYQSTDLYGRLFLENTAWVETFATDAALDIVVFTPALPEALGLHTDILSRSEFDASGPSSAARPGRIILTYRSGAVPGSTVTTRTVRFPHYGQSGHAVTLTEPQELLEDVMDWLGDTGSQPPNDEARRIS